MIHLLLYTWIFFVRHGKAQSGKTNYAYNYFIDPPPPGQTAVYSEDEVWPIGSVQTISWFTNITNQYSIQLLQASFESDPVKVSALYTSSTSAIGQQSFQWTVSTYSTNLQSSDVYYLMLIDTTGDYAFNAHYFNISAASAATTSSTSSPSSTSSITSTSPTSSTTTTGISSTSSSESSNPSTTATSSSRSSATASSAARSSITSTASLANPAPASATDGGSTDSGKASVALPVGLGVGLGIIICSLLVAGIWLGIRAIRRRRALAIKARAFPHFDNPFPPPGYPTQNGLAEAFSQSLHEAPSKTPVLAELDAYRYTRELP